VSTAVPPAAPAPRDDWDAHWDEYDAAVVRNPAQAYRRRIVGALLERDGAPRRLLDVGSGQGDFAAEALTRWPGVELLGVEYSASGVRASERKAPAARFLQADLLEPGIAPAAADAAWGTHAVCSEVLEHVDDPVGLMRAARAWMATGCRVVVTVPGGPMSAFDQHIGHRRHFTPDDLRDLLGAAGYRTVLAGGAGFPFFNLYRSMVIARGKKLVDDVSSSQGAGGSPLARAAMTAFDPLFRVNLPRSPLGWQTWAVAYCA
jgi:SAM-dependent methyltransferase